MSTFNNHFQLIGENAIATWGHTEGYDATRNDFPMYTLIENNVMRELGIYEKQSSAVGICKSALNTIRNNIIFNTARAAINFNDLVGGGDVVEGNLIFNTCRESGDHGPINSWDRQPFLTNLRYGGAQSSFDPLPRLIRRNFIFANYGASQGVDNDDGSSFFHINHNLFYMADGFKMDYGGHDSRFENNMVLSFSNNGGPCFNMGNFLKGHGDVLRGNKCLIGLGEIDKRSNSKHSVYSSSIFGNELSYTTRKLEARFSVEDKEEPPFVGRLWEGCFNSHVTLTSNKYYTPDGIARIACGERKFLNLSKVVSEFGLEENSTNQTLPGISEIIAWARSMVMKPINSPLSLISVAMK